MGKSFNLELKSEFTEAEKIPDFVEDFSQKMNLSDDLMGRVMLALSEAATNAIVHGNEEDFDKVVEIKVDIDEKLVLITVQDEGTGFNPEDIPDPIKEENLLQTGGRGIFLMVEYADTVTFSDDGRLVTMTFKR
jgi:serine/threonine-protein kinase RsbW